MTRLRVFHRILASAGVAIAMFVAGPTAGNELILAGMRTADLTPQLFPEGLVKRSGIAGGRNGYKFTTFREPELYVAAGRFELAMFWNGIDDEKWPYTRILGMLLSKACGIPEGDLPTKLLDAAYDSKPIGPTEELGGNAGVSRIQRHSVEDGDCRISVEIAGARWHTITTTVTGR